MTKSNRTLLFLASASAVLFLLTSNPDRSQEANLERVRAIGEMRYYNDEIGRIHRTMGSSAAVGELEEKINGYERADHEFQKHPSTWAEQALYVGQNTQWKQFLESLRAEVMLKRNASVNSMSVELLEARKRTIAVREAHTGALAVLANELQDKVNLGRDAYIAQQSAESTRRLLHMLGITGLVASAALYSVSRMRKTWFELLRAFATLRPFRRRSRKPLPQQPSTPAPQVVEAGSLDLRGTEEVSGLVPNTQSHIGEVTPK